jgi:cytochrome c biogenesis protein CcmG, thiol:disulfide interchange protein DsbE
MLILLAAGAARSLHARHHRSSLVHNAIVMNPIRSRGRLLLPVAALVAALVAVPVAATEAGQPAPAFTLPNAKGETVALERMRGKVVYVDFWASWCGPCRRSFPWMNEMQQKYGARGLVVVGVNVDKKRGDADRFLAQIPANFTVVFDEAGATPSAYGVKGMPSSYVIDARGNVTFVERGFLDENKAVLEQRIADALAAARI